MRKPKDLSGKPAPASASKPPVAASYPADPAPDGPNSGLRRGRKKGSGEQILAVNYHGKAYQFYKTCPWDKWWDEFSTSTMPNGALRYPTGWSFARAKAKNNIQEQNWIWAAIGPKPVLDEKRKKPVVPWLGDWLMQRQKSFWFGTGKAEALARVLRERQNALEAARAVGAIHVDWIRRTMGLANQVDNFFGGQMLLPELSLKENARRASLYLKAHNELFSMCSQATEAYLRCHGIHQDDVTVLAQIAAVSARASMSANTEQSMKEEQAHMLARCLMAHAENFEMPLPDSLSPENKAKNDEFVKSFPLERFSALAGFFKSCFAHEAFDLNGSARSAVAEFCEHSSREEIVRVDREFAEFLTLRPGTTHEVMQRIATERFDALAPNCPEDWGALRNRVAICAEKHYGPDWRK